MIFRIDSDFKLFKQKFSILRVEFEVFQFIETKFGEQMKKWITMKFGIQRVEA